MKRDLELIRKILLAMEANEGGFGREQLAVPDDVTNEVIGNHVWLMGEAGLISFVIGSSRSSRLPTAIASDSYLTWQGHEFLDLIRADARWQRARKVAGDDVEVLKAVLTDMAKKAAGLGD